MRLGAEGQALRSVVRWTALGAIAGGPLGYLAAWLTGGEPIGWTVVGALALATVGGLAARAVPPVLALLHALATTAVYAFGGLVGGMSSVYLWRFIWLVVRRPAADIVEVAAVPLAFIGATVAVLAMVGRLTREETGDD